MAMKDVGFADAKSIKALTTRSSPRLAVLIAQASQ
jgi:hypothetical protein